MGEHLSTLAIDELLAGDPNPAASEHLAACAECRARSEARRLERDRAKAEPGFERVLREIQSPRRRFSWKRFGAIAIPVTAMAVFLILPPQRVTESPSEDRVKGGASLAIVGADGSRAFVVHAGQPLKLLAGGGGHPYALIFSVDDRGELVQRWPPSGESGALPAGVKAPLEPALAAGDRAIALWAFYSEAPLAPQIVERSLSAAVSASSGGPLLAEPRPLEGEAARARYLLCVEGQPCPR